MTDMTPEQKAIAEKRACARSQYQRALQLTTEWAAEQLLAAPDYVHAYIAKRGVTTPSDFDIGWIDEHSELIKFLRRNKVNLSVAYPLGIPKNLANSLSKRIWLPWRDATGRLLNAYPVLAEKTRRPGDANYLEKDHPDFRENKVSLPNLKVDGEVVVPSKCSPFLFDRARRAGHTDVVIVEGVWDALAAQAAGDTSTVAPVGGQLSHDQIDTLKRYAVETATIALDPDKGGESGTQSCIRNLTAKGIETFVCARLPDDTDPDDLILGEGLEAWKQYTENAIGGWKWMVNQAIPDDIDGLSDRAKSTATKAAKEIIDEVSCPVTRSELIEFVRLKFDIQKRVANQKFGTKPKKKTSQPTRRPDKSELPDVHLPGGSVSISETAEKFGKLFSDKNKLFLRGGIVSEVSTSHNNIRIAEMQDAAFPSHAEKVASLVDTVKVDGEPTVVKSIMGTVTGKTIVAAEDFLSRLPEIKVISQCPVITNDGEGGLKVVCGYDKQSGIYANGAKPESMSIEEAVELILGVLQDFRFTTPADKSRAVASIITPAMVLGDLLGDRAPLDMGEADQSQTGKSLRNRLTAAFYRDSPTVVTQTSKGVGSIEEKFSQALIDGRSFISLDNLRGKIDSPAIEAFLTEDSFTARASHSRNVLIDPRRTVVMATSNAAESTTDLANRCSIVRILYNEPGYEFTPYTEGLVDFHVRANQPKYLGAVFAVIRAWHDAGRPETNETRHARRGWARKLDWIAQDLFSLPPLMDGHVAAQKRQSNKSLSWLREIANAIMAQNRGGEWLFTSNILEILNEQDLEIPGVREGQTIDDSEVHRSARTQVGQRLSRCFRASASVDSPEAGQQTQNVEMGGLRSTGERTESVEIDSWIVTRTKRQDEFRNNAWIYRVDTRSASVCVRRESVGESVKVATSSVASVDSYRRHTLEKVSSPSTEMFFPDRESNAPQQTQQTHAPTNGAPRNGKPGRATI